MKTNMKLASTFCEAVLGLPIDNFQPIPVSGDRLARVVWQLNGFFQARIKELDACGYEPKFASQADEAIEAFVVHADFAVWENQPIGVIRVLYERHKQILVVAVANNHADNHVTFFPDGLPTEAELPLVLLTLYHGLPVPL